MECEKFLVEYGLYDKQKIGYEDFTDLINLLSGKVKIDVYCSESLAAQEQREEQERFEQFLKDNGLVTLKYFCSKDESHSLTYILFIEDGYIRKIGQYPS